MMKGRIHRVASSRSFTRSLSIVAVAVAAFAALELLAAQHAFAATKCCTKNSLGQFTTNCYCDSALPCNTGFSSTGLTCPLPYTTSTSTYSSGGTINSTISCTGRPGQGQNNVDLNTVSQTAILDCTVSGSVGGVTDGEAVCQLDLSYTRPSGLTTSGVPQCVANPDGTSTLTDVAFCADAVSGGGGNRLMVAGTLNCNPPGLNPSLPAVCGGNTACTMNLGVNGVSAGQCPDVFTATTGLVAGQVLSVSAIVEGPTCTGQIVSFGDILTKYCNGGSFNGAPAKCIFGTGRTAENSTIIGTTDVAIPFDVDFDPAVLNVTCNPQNRDAWRFTIVGNEVLDVARINQSSLKVEGFSGVTCGTAVGNTLSCEVRACPQLGPFVAGERNSDGTVDLTVTGNLVSGTAILGEQHVQTSGQ
jgi:hypothetical protein